MSASPRIVPLGDSAFIVVLGERIAVELSTRVARLAAEIRALTLPGVLGIVPGYAELAVHFDPCATDGDGLALRLQALAVAERNKPAPEDGSSGRLHVLPVRYDGPDLVQVAERTGLAASEVARRHAAATYRVLLLGFVPGFAYLGPLDPALLLPRRSAPRRRVPAGSVAIAGAQTAVYPLETPGGWHLIGRTETVLFDPKRDPPNLLASGDRVRFQPIDP